MLKIAIVLATTFLFGGLLIAYPYSPDQARAMMGRASGRSEAIAAADSAWRPQTSSSVTPAPNTAAEPPIDTGRRFVKGSTAGDTVDHLRFARHDKRDPETFPLDRITDKRTPSGIESRHEATWQGARKRNSEPVEKISSKRRPRNTRHDLHQSDPHSGARARNRSHVGTESESHRPAGTRSHTDFGRRAVLSRDRNDYESTRSESARLVDVIEEQFSHQRHHRRKACRC
jgi:hypothetical protein